jgi:hypothetical protein
MAKAPEAPTGRRRLADAAGSLGRPLREIMGEEVTVTAIAFESDHQVRALADDPEAGIKKGDKVNREVVILTVDSIPPTRYFSFSPSLVEKLRPIDGDALPMDARFVQRDLGNGQKVWDVE